MHYIVQHSGKWNYDTLVVCETSLTWLLEGRMIGQAHEQSDAKDGCTRINTRPYSMEWSMQPGVEVSLRVQPQRAQALDAYRRTKDQEINDVERCCVVGQALYQVA